MKFRTLTVRGVPDVTLRRLRQQAEANRRSLNGELLTILDRAVVGASVPPVVVDVAAVREPAAAPYAAIPASPSPLLGQVDLEALAAICRRHHVRWLAVFGSHARGDARPDSDIDVVVDFEPGMTPGFGIVRVAEALRPIFEGRRVDLVTRPGLAPRLRAEILASARSLYAAG